MQHRPMAAQRGFTLIELLTVMSIAGVLAAVGIPALLDTVRSAQLRSSTSQLYEAILLARSEAVKRNREVDVQPGTSCVSPSSSNTALWTTGWSVWVMTQAGACDTTVPVLQQFPASTNIAITPAAGGISYLSTGRITTTSASSFDLKSTKSSTIPERCIVLSASGQPSVRVGVASSACS